MLSIPDLVHSSWNVEIEFHRILDHNKFNNEARRMQRMMNDATMHECRKQRKNNAARYLSLYDNKCYDNNECTQ